MCRVTGGGRCRCCGGGHQWVGSYQGPVAVSKSHLTEGVDSLWGAVGGIGLTGESWRWAVEMVDCFLHFVFGRGRCGCGCIWLAFGVLFLLWLEWAIIAGRASFVFFVSGRHRLVPTSRSWCEGVRGC